MLKAGRERTPRWPDIVQIESTNLCNAKCVFCPRDEMHRRQGVMDMDLFKKVVDECVTLGTSGSITTVNPPSTSSSSKRCATPRSVASPKWA